MNNIHAYNMAGADGQTITNEKLLSWNITINQNVVNFCQIWTLMMTRWRVQVSLYEKRRSSHQQQVLCHLSIYILYLNSLWYPERDICKSPKACWTNQSRRRADTQHALHIFLYRSDTA